MKKLASVFLLLAPGVLGHAQSGKPEQSPTPPVVSPQVSPDHRVTFRLRAPNANSVTVSGDFWHEQGRTEKLAKGEDGVWTLTTEPLQPDMYSYWFTVDGVPMPDPADGLIKPGIQQTQSAFILPGGPRATVLEEKDVPHGEVRTVYYKANTLGTVQRMHIYLPPGYDGSTTRYPVTYLFHGSGDDDSAWEAIGRANFVLDNLIAQGKAKPMILVMPSLWAMPAPIPQSRAAENEALFQKTLVHDLVPYIEAHYRVLPGRENRALGGLGLGRNMLPDVLWPSLGDFNNVLFVSGGADADRFALLQKEYPGVLDNPETIKRVKFFFGDGVNDGSFPSAKNLVDELKRRGYQVTFEQTDDTHGWPEFRHNFVEFAQTAFR